MRKYVLILTGLILIYAAAGQPITPQEYQRATGFHFRHQLLNKKIFNLDISPSWFSDSSGFFYEQQNKDGRTYYKILFRNTKPELLFDHHRVAGLLTVLLKKEVQPGDLPISNLQYVSRDSLSFIVNGKGYKLMLKNYTIHEQTSREVNRIERLSPDGKYIAYTENYNLFIRSTRTGEKIQLSKAGFKNYEYASFYGWADIMIGENGDRPPHFSVSWSPDSKWIQTYICDLRSANKMYLLDWSQDTLYRPRLLSYYRGSPGDTNMVYMTPVFFNMETKEEYRRDEKRNTHINTTGYEWSSKPGIIYESDRKRGFKEVELSVIDLARKKSEIIFAESSPTNIDNYDYDILDDNDEALITSEKDGWKHVYLADIKSKKISPVTTGEFYINDILFINKQSRQIVFAASGREEGRNPYFRHIYSVRFDGSDLRLLTPENANHDASVSPDGKYFVDNISAPDQPTKTVLRDVATGKVLVEFSKAVIDDLLAMNYRFPETFTAIARDRKTTIYGAIWKPVDFDPGKKYPVIDQSYTGPHTNMFPRNFISSLARNNQALAQLGFIVITVDGMGTAGRSKAFHDVSYKNMGKNLTDHVLAIKELGRKYSWIDTSRVGIFGHSAGGYDAGHAVLEFPDFYKVAVASSADHDFRMEKAWWPEMYMGWPVDSLYHQVSNITMAENLKGKLLITHGGIDENVNPSATFKLAEALVRANKEFDMLIFPGQRHGYQAHVGDYFTKKLWNYFVQHLRGVEPIWDFKLRWDE